MRTLVFDTHRFERPFFEKLNADFRHELAFSEARLTEETAVLAQGFPCVCAFVNDRLNAQVLEKLKTGGTRLIALRSAGFNHVDLEAACRLGLKVVRVPAYSPYAVAEHTIALLLCLNRKLHRAAARVREMNFSLDGLVGFDLHGKTVGVIGTGKIGGVFAKIMQGFGCRVLAYDPAPRKDLGTTQFVPLDRLLAEADVVSLHLPLTPETRHLMNEQAFQKMKPGAILLNTGRGALVDASCLIQALKSGKLGGAALDVYEEEENVFFQDLSEIGVKDDLLARLLTFPNVLITSHQAFLTREALENIVKTTLANIREFETGTPLSNEVLPEKHLA